MKIFSESIGHLNSGLMFVFSLYNELIRLPFKYYVQNLLIITYTQNLYPLVKIGIHMTDFLGYMKTLCTCPLLYLSHLFAITSGYRGFSCQGCLNISDLSCYILHVLITSIRHRGSNYPIHPCPSVS